MKKLLMMLFILLCCAGAALADGDEYWTTKDDPHYHAEETCGGAAEMRPISLDGAREFQKYPCPRCVQPGTNTCGPAWCADPATYNSSMDAYRDGRAILAGDSVYIAQSYGWGDGTGELLMRVDADGGSAGAEIVRDLGRGASILVRHGIFDLGDGILYLEANTNTFHKIDYAGETDQPLFATASGASPYFLLLVGDRLYSAEDRAVGWYDLTTGGFTALCEIPKSSAEDWHAVYAEGTLLLGLYDGSFRVLAIDAQTGAQTDVTAALGAEIPRAFIALNGRIYAGISGGDLISANCDGSGVQTLTAAPEGSVYSLNRAYGRYVFATNQTYTPSEYIYLAQRGAELRFEPAEMQRAVTSMDTMFYLNDRVYIENGIQAEDHSDVHLYDSYDLEAYIANQLANPPEERRDAGLDF